MTIETALRASLSSLGRVLTWSELVLLAAGVFIGAVVGILPGLGGATTLALLLPFVFPLEPAQAFALLIGVAAVTATTGDLTSILLGVPGEATSAALVVDGHPMARRGEAGRAIGASLFSSLAGSVFGALTLGLTVPVAAYLTRSVASPELFMLALLGVTFVGPLSGASRVKGLATGGLGLLLATVGQDPLTATPRFAFGSLALLDGMGAVPVALGMFAVPELVELASMRGTAQSAVAAAGAGVWDGARDAARRWRVVLRGSVIGAAVGLLPGVGASVSQWIAYADAARRSRDTRPFGSGAIDGVIAPSAANNATLGGALAPTLALGVPGSLMSALLLGALIMKGLVPGPRLLAPEAVGGHLELVFAVVWFMVLGNLLAVALASAAGGALVRVTQIRPRRLVPFLLLLIFVGAFTERQSFEDVVVMCAMGGLGLLLARYGWPRTPLLLGLVLGPLAENRVVLSQEAYGAAWLLRPGVLLLAGVMVTILVLPFRRPNRSRDTSPAPPTLEECLFAGALAIVAASALAVGASYAGAARVMPIFASAATLVALCAALVHDLRKRGIQGARFQLPRANPAVAWGAGFLILIWALGFSVGAPLAVLAYLIVNGEHPLASLILAAATYAALDIVMFRCLAVRFPAGVLMSWATRGAF